MSERLPILDRKRRELPAAAASLRGAVTHTAKTRVLQARRLGEWAMRPHDFGRPKRVSDLSRFPHMTYERSIPILRDDSAAHAALEGGKRTNLNLAAAAFDGLLLTPGEPMSFWRVLGRLTESRGYRPGLEISAGCLVPAIGGGVCLLANALFEMAARVGWNIVERHGHTQEAVPPRAGELWGLDATVFWPYVDLRLAPRSADAVLSVRVDRDELILKVSAASPMLERIELSSTDERVEQTPAGPMRFNRVIRRISTQSSGDLLDERVIADNRRLILTAEEMGRTCYTCGETDCHRRAADA